MGSCVPWRRRCRHVQHIGRLTCGVDADEDEEIDDDALLDAWEEMDRQAVSVLHHPLPPSLPASAPDAELASAGPRLRAGLRSRQWPYMIIGQANGCEGCRTSRRPMTNCGFSPRVRW
jgi:hypothetical protein